MDNKASTPKLKNHCYEAPILDSSIAKAQEGKFEVPSNEVFNRLS